ncbi:MAG: hypothetical protein ACRCU1_05700 [Alsobacter sp.]
MMLAYFAGAGLIVAAGQQNGSELLEAAIQQDMSIDGLMAQGGRLSAIGISAADAAIIVAGAGIAFKLLQMATPFTETLNLWLRAKLLDKDGDGLPDLPQHPGKGEKPGR